MSRREGVTIPRIGVAAVLSVLVHVALLWQWWSPELRSPSPDTTKHHASRGPLSVRIVPRAAQLPKPTPVQPRAPAPLVARPQSRETPRVRQARPRPAPRAPVIALDKPAPSLPAPLAERPAPVAPRAPGETDLAAYVAARRRARAEPAPTPPVVEGVPHASPAEDENTRANRIAAMNLGTARKPEFGADPRRGGGVFTIQRLGYDYAEFAFYGWNQEIRRNTAQLIEVRKGANSNIRIAVVRRMIAIIREHEKEDFVWDSPRLGRKLTLSARARDNRGLEEFLMREFFGEGRQSAWAPDP